MAPEVAEVLETAKSLERDQMADLAYELLRVLDDGDSPRDQPSIDAAWNAELARRVAEFESAQVEPVSHEETAAQARALLAARDR